MNPDIEMALAHHKSMNTTRQWARLEMTLFGEDNRVIRLMVGPIQNGVKQSATLTRRYVLNKDNTVSIVEHSHG